MCLNVFLQVVELNELFFTNLTDMISLVAVDQTVILQGLLYTESLVTVRASERSLTGVDTKVSLQIITESKIFATLSTMMWSYIIVNSEVIFHMVTGNRFLTPRTLQLFSWSGSHLTRVYFHMSPVVILSNFYLANLALDSTNNWSSTGVDRHVACPVMSNLIPIQ